MKGNNNIADFCYKNLKYNDKVIICGEIDSKMEVIINEITTKYLYISKNNI